MWIVGRFDCFCCWCCFVRYCYDVLIFVLQMLLFCGLVYIFQAFGLFLLFLLLNLYIRQVVIFFLYYLDRILVFVVNFREVSILFYFKICFIKKVYQLFRGWVQGCCVIFVFVIGTFFFLILIWFYVRVRVFRFFFSTFSILFLWVVYICFFFVDFQFQCVQIDDQF